MYIARHILLCARMMNVIQTNMYLIEIARKLKLQFWHLNILF